ncbi:hypothetical protein ACH4UM_16020 [Streptomyces sp. NPDC020801]|uniref:hypothetical protein n=1 Tax=unclassified Streptomyces TaxID=2593676 RepID=UPI0037A36CC4
MQWTDGSGAAYGEDPYAGAGYAYACGHEGGGSIVTDTATLSWDPVQLAQWTHPTGHTQAMGPGPHATAMPVHAAAPDPAATAWAAPIGDVLTVPPPEFAAPGIPVPAPDTPAGASVRPVFVDSSGRRQRRVRRAARLLVIPAGGYVALLISTMLGGSGVSSPFVPQPEATHPATPRATAPDSAPGTGHLADGARSTARKNSRPAAQTTPSPTGRPAASTAPAVTSGPTRIASPTSTAAPAPAPTPGSKGRALGSSHKPVK